MKKLNIKIKWKLFIGWTRIIWGFCPYCNSDAPVLYDCPICEYDTSSPFNKAKRIYYWSRFKLYLKGVEMEKILRGISCDGSGWKEKAVKRQILRSRSIKKVRIVMKDECRQFKDLYSVVEKYADNIRKINTNIAGLPFAIGIILGYNFRLFQDYNRNGENGTEDEFQAFLCIRDENSDNTNWSTFYNSEEVEEWYDEHKVF